MSQQFSGSPLCPPTLHSESSSPPVEVRKMETLPSKQNGSSEKPAEGGTEPRASEGQVQGAHVLSAP